MFLLVQVHCVVVAVAVAVVVVAVVVVAGDNQNGSLHSASPLPLRPGNLGVQSLRQHST